MAQVSVHGVGGRGFERLRAEASRLRRPTIGHVVLRAARSFLPAFSQPSTPILFGLSLQVCQVSVKLAWHLEGAGDGLLACPVPGVRSDRADMVIPWNAPIPVQARAIGT